MHNPGCNPLKLSSISPETISWRDPDDSGNRNNTFLFKFQTFSFLFFVPLFPTFFFVQTIKNQGERVKSALKNVQGERLSQNGLAPLSSHTYIFPILLSEPSYEFTTRTRADSPKTRCQMRIVQWNPPVSRRCFDCIYVAAHKNKWDHLKSDVMPL